VSLQLRGIVHGKQIELEHETGLPAGSPIVVNLQPRPLTLEERRGLVDVLRGAWADDTSLASIFEEIERQRTLRVPRDVDFNAAS